MGLPQDLYVDDDVKSKGKGKSDKTKTKEIVAAKDPKASPSKKKISKKDTAVSKASLVPKTLEKEEGVILTRCSKRITVQVVTDAPRVVGLGSAVNDTEGIDFKRRKKNDKKDLNKNDEVDDASIAK